MVSLKVFNKKNKIESTSDFYIKPTVIAIRDWLDSDEGIFVMATNLSSKNLISKIREISKPLSDFTDIQRGVTPFHIEAQPSHPNSRSAFSGTVRRYKIEFGPESFIRFDETLAEYKPEKYFKGERILVRELISRQFQIQAMLTNVDFITNKSMQSIINTSEYDIRFILGMINSKLLSWYFLTISQIAQRDDFPKIVLKETRSLPCPIIDLRNSLHKAIHDEISNLVSQRLNCSDQDVEQLEFKIDQLVFKLFDLSEEEIGLITNQIQ